MTEELPGEVWADETIAENTSQQPFAEALQLVVEHLDHVVDQSNALADKHNALAEQVSAGLSLHATALALICRTLSQSLSDPIARGEFAKLANLLQAAVHNGDHPPSLQP